MVRKFRPQAQVESLSTPTSKSELRASAVTSTIEKVATLLQEDRPDKALESLNHCRLVSPWISNAIGVCQLHLGNTQQAVKIFQGLVMSSGIQLNRDVPTAFKANYAAALLAADNLEGCLNVLHEIKEEDNPAVLEIRDAIRRWRESLPLWRKLLWCVGAYPRRSEALEWPMGRLE